jgi:NodT family efflux transporter outer membrane factor (OMF) lipoprotein
MRRVRLTGAPLLAATLAACSFAPHYRTPASPPPAERYQELGDWKPATPGDAAPRGEWWRSFGDADLDALETKAAAANESLKAGFARLQQARAQTRIARAGLLPHVTAQAAPGRVRTSQNSPRFPTGEEPVYNNFDLEADLSYELDVWGRIRNTVAAAKAGQQASAADLASLNLAIQAELALDYYALRGAEAEQALLDRTVADYAKALDLTRNLYQGGAAALADVAQAEAQLDTARTQAADVTLQRAQTLHALAVLVGENPTSFRLAVSPLPLVATPPPLDPGLPSALLERRPDVAAAERRVAAANATIGVARAAYFPVFSLTGAAGYDSATYSSLLQAPSRLWALGGSGVLTVFDAGLHRAQSAQARAAYDEHVADYRNAVLGAYQEVEDQIAALRQLALESDSEAAAVTASAKALEQAMNLYRAGATTYLQVVSTENAALQAQVSALSIQTRRLSATVLLVKALGGGWQAGSPPAQ